MKEKMRRNFWISPEIECMLNLLREVYKIQGNTATTNYTFIQIANRMKKRGFPNKTAAQIRRKWFQMKSAYLCYKRGNVERLLLIPERFRTTIAEFVDTEIKPKYRDLSPSPEIVPPTPPPPPEPAPVQTPKPTINTNSNSKIREPTNSTKPPLNAGKAIRRDCRFDDFLMRVKQTHKIISNDFTNMQKILMDFEHACQAERDAKIVTFIKNINYIAAVLQGHVVPTVPYISDDGTYSPESCVFGQLINIGSILLGITIYIRYRQIQQLYSHHPDLGSLLLRYNKIAFWFGLASCLGISIVGNFQETNVRIVHFTGAFCCFGCGTVYFWLQAITTYMVYPIAGTKLYGHIRLGMSLCCTILFILIAITGVMSHILFKGDNPRQWYPSDGGWYFHVVSSISEWIMATIFCFYILTFTEEFRDVRLDHPELSFISHTITV